VVCNQCGSENITKLSLIYQGGVSEVTTTTRTAQGDVRATGRHVTEAARRAAPPEKHDVVGALFFTLFALAVAYCGTQLGNPAFALLSFLAPYARWITIATVALAIIFAYNGIQAYRFNTLRWPALYDYWTRCFQCGKCGEVGPRA